MATNSSSRIRSSVNSEDAYLSSLVALRVFPGSTSCSWAAYKPAGAGSRRKDDGSQAGGVRQCREKQSPLGRE